MGSGKAKFTTYGCKITSEIQADNQNVGMMRNGHTGTHPAVEGSRAMFPAAMTTTRARQKSTIGSEHTGFLGNRPRLNLRSNTEIGKSAKTARKAREKTLLTMVN
jgi:hypothetical protein